MTQELIGLAQYKILNLFKHNALQKIFTPDERVSIFSNISKQKKKDT